MAVNSQKEYIIISSEGYINSKLETRNSKLPFRPGRKGYTLVEMVVVMGIAAVIMLIGVGAFVMVRNQYLLDAKVEATITAIRDAQNRAIASMKVNDENPKAWGVSFKNGSPDQISLFYTDGATRTSAEEILESGGAVGIGLINPDFGTDTGNIIFTSPFGNSYLIAGSCNLVLSNKPTKEYIPDGSCTTYDEMVISLSFGNQSQSITVNRRGDVTTN